MTKIPAWIQNGSSETGLRWDDMMSFLLCSLKQCTNKGNRRRRIYMFTTYVSRQNASSSGLHGSLESHPSMLTVLHFINTQDAKQTRHYLGEKKKMKPSDASPSSALPESSSRILQSRKKAKWA